MIQSTTDDQLFRMKSQNRNESVIFYKAYNHDVVCCMLTEFALHHQGFFTRFPESTCNTDSCFQGTSLENLMSYIGLCQHCISHAI